MSTDCQLFSFGEEPVRVLMQYGQPWFVAVDVCRVLEIGNSRDAIAALEADEKGVGNADTLGGAQEVNIISESGLYALIFKSRKVKAKTFRKWVTGEVLPALRTRGTYSIGAQSPTEADEVREMVMSTLRALRSGSADPERAQAIFAGARIWAQLEARRNRGQGIDAAESGICTDEETLRQWGLLVDAMVEGSVGTLWTSDSLRALAYRLGLFNRWLTRDELHTPATRSRFGKISAAMDGRVFGNFRFVAEGENRSRRFRLEPVAELIQIKEATR